VWPGRGRILRSGSHTGCSPGLTVETTDLYHGKKHLFLFENYRGTLVFNARKPEESKIELTIDSRSAVCKDDWVSSGDLRKIMETTFEDMLAVKQFPTMTFVSGSVRPIGGNQFEAQGNLTIRNTPKPVTVNVQLDGIDPSKAPSARECQDPSERLRFEAALRSAGSDWHERRNVACV